MIKQQLAANGGAPAIPVALKARFNFGREERDAVVALLDRSVATGTMFGYQGAEEEAFGKEFAAFLGGGYADGVNSGTNALYVALKALELPPFSEVIVGCVTDPGGIMAIVENACIPILADTLPGSYNTGAAMIEPLITDRTRAIVVAHIGGEPADMPAIMAVAGKHGLKVVEDCAQSHLATIDGQNAGTFGDIGVFSLMFGKHICTGGQGGAVFTRSEELYWKVRRAADRGKPFGLPAGSTNVVSALNCNMDEMHAAIGRVQLRKLPEITARRRVFVALLTEMGLKDLKAVRIPPVPAGAEHCYWWWKLRVDASRLTCSKDEFCAAIQAEGVPINPSYTAALPGTFVWFKDRATRFPWNAAEYKGDARQEFPCPNALAVMASHFNLTVLESWGEAEAETILRAFQKVESVLAR